MRHGRSRRLLLAAVLNVAVIGVPALAQDAPTPTDAQVGVFVRDSAVAAEKMTLAERMEKAQEWDTSAEVYQEVLDGFSDRVIPTHTDAQGRPDRYGSVATVIQDRIAAWPDAGREEYINRYSTVAKRLLDAAAPGDRAALSTVANRYFVTEAGRDASLLLIERYFNNGEFVAAAVLADRLLDKHPAISAELRPLLLLRSSLSWKLANEPARAAARANTLSADFADTTASLGGVDQPVARVADDALKQSGNLAARVRDDAWPMPFGTLDHASVAKEVLDGQPREWGKLTSFELHRATNLPENGPQFAALRAMVSRQRDLGAMTGILPVIDGNQLFFQDNTRVYARDLTTGEPLPGWMKSYPGDQGQYKVDGSSTPRGAQLAVTLADRYLLAIMNQNDSAMAMYGGAVMGNAKVVCLDRETGQPVWVRRMSDPAMQPGAPREAAVAVKPPPANETRQQRQQRVARELGVQIRQMQAGQIAMGNNGGDGSFAQTQPCGSVLVVGDAVYFVTRGGQAGAFEDSYLICLSLADGIPRWTRHLASGSVGRNIQNMNGNGMIENVADSHLAYADGRVYISTDMGAIAAVEAADGSLAWLSVYPRPRPQQPNYWRGDPSQLSSDRVEPAFAGNPVIVRDGKVLTMPVDAEYLFVHDAVTGQELARVPMRWRLTEDFALTGAAEGNRPTPGTQIDTNNVLAGLTSDSVVIASPRSVSVLDWTKLRAKEDGSVNELAPRDVLRYRREMSKTGFEDNSIRGRPFVTDQSIYVPTAWKLYRFNADASRALEQYPTGDDWQNRKDEGPGNLIVMNGTVVVAGPERVSIYAGLGLVRKQLDAAIAAAPDAVAPRLRYAEAMFNVGRNDEAITWLDQAIGQLAGRAADDAQRVLTFNECVTLLRQQAQPERKPDAAFQAKLLERLDAIAATPSQRASALLLSSALAVREKNFADAAAKLQALIFDPSLAAMSLDVNGATVGVGVYATTQIEKLITENGRDVYGAIETQAKEKLAAAQATGGVRQLVAVAAAYPNALAAKDALRTASQQLAKLVSSAPANADVRKDRAQLRSLAAQLGEPADRLAIHDALLHSYAAAGDLDAALGQARRLAWADENRSIDPVANSTATTAGALVAELQARAFVRDEAQLPDLKANFEGNSFDVENPINVKDVSTLLVPENHADARNDRIVVLSRDGTTLRIYAPGASTPLASVAGLKLTKAASCAWVGTGDTAKLMVYEADKALLIDPSKSAVAWTFQTNTPDNASNAVANAETTLAIDASGLVALSGESRPAAEAPPLNAEQQQLQQMINQGQIDPVRGQQLMIRAQIRQRQQAQVIFRGPVNGNIRLNDGGVVSGDWEPDPRLEGDDPAAAPNRRLVELTREIRDARPLADGKLIALSTGGGQVVVLDVETGKLRWRNRFGDRPLAYFNVVGDLVVAATTDESRSRLVAFDAFDGSETLRRTYTSGQQPRINNVAVNDEGLLVVVQESALSCFDLFAGESEPFSRADVQSTSGLPPFRMTRDSDLVQLCGGRVLVMSDMHQQPPIVRSFDLKTLAPTQSAGNARSYAPIYANNRRDGNESYAMAIHKDRLYVMTDNFLVSYPALDDPKAQWTRTPGDQPTLLSRQSPMFVKDGLLLIGWPKAFADKNARTASLELYSRQLIDGNREVGMAVEELELNYRQGNLIDTFQPVDGGVYFVTTEGTLRFLKGSH